MKPITLYTGALGLNDKLDPQRLISGSLREAPGFIELSQATDVSIDDRGLVSRRSGSTQVTAGNFHSLFCDNGTAFVIEERTEDAAIMRINADHTLTGIRSGLTKNKRMAWCQVQDATFYSNTVHIGVIRNSVSATWAVSTYNGPDSSESFASSIPLATHIGHRNGILGLAVGNVVFFNHLPYLFGLFSLARGFVQFESAVKMVKPVAGGWFISDAKNTWFFKGDTPLNFSQQLAANYPAHEWGDATEYPLAADMGIDAQGVVALWSSTEGICAGMPDGSLINLTHDKVTTPTATTAASLVFDRQKLIVCGE